MVEREKPRGLILGTSHMLILNTLALEPMHGYGIGMRIDQLARGVPDQCFVITAETRSDDCFGSHHSARRAITGSMRSARRAGR